MKQKQILGFALALIFVLQVIRAEAQLINQKDKFYDFYIPASSLSNHYNIWTGGAYRVNGIKNIQFNKEHKIKVTDDVVYKLTKQGKRLKEKRRTIHTFDKNGRLIDEQHYKKGREKQHYQFQYNKYGFFTDYKKHARGILKKHEVLVYNQNNDVLKYRRYHKGELESKWEAVYKDTILESQWSYKITKKDSSDILLKWEYEYYPTNQKKQTKYYKKGELKHTWLYTCDEEGIEVKPKDETKVCEIKQYNNDGTYVIVQRNTGKKGKITKTRLTYDAKDHLIMREYINAKNKIWSKQSYKYDDKGRQIAWYYYKNGKKSDQVHWGREDDYNENGKIVETRHIGRKGTAYAKYTYKYNDKDLRVSSSYIDLKKNKQVYRFEYKYNENNLLVERLKYNRKDMLSMKFITNYQYY